MRDDCGQGPADHHMRIINFKMVAVYGNGEDWRPREAKAAWTVGRVQWHLPLLGVAQGLSGGVLNIYGDVTQARRLTERHGPACRAAMGRDAGEGLDSKVRGREGG